MDLSPGETQEIDPAEYCREVEAHLCRRNDGHLVRLVGPTFEMVLGWATRGIPLRVTLEGIDRCLERYHRKGPRRRPLQISFAEADVLDLFDDWRRAVGVPLAAAAGTAAANADGGSGERPAARAAASLPAHLERVIARLTVLRARPEVDVVRQDVLTSAIRELDGVKASARGLRGAARAAALQRLAALDAELLHAFGAALPADRRAALHGEAERELAAFRARMSADAWEQAVRSATSRLVRETSGLPVVRYE